MDVKQFDSALDDIMGLAREECVKEGIMSLSDLEALTAFMIVSEQLKILNCEVECLKNEVKKLNDKTKNEKVVES